MGTLLAFRRQAAAPPACALPTACAAFLADQGVGERSKRTIAGHAAELRRFARWLDGQGLAWDQLSAREIDGYVRTRAHRGRSARANLMTTLRVFYRWAVSQQLVAASPAEHLRTPPRAKTVPRALSVEQVRLLLAYLDNHAVDGVREQRDRALLLTALYTGMRAAELAGCRWGQIDLAAGAVTIPLSKMAKGRTLTLHPDLVPILVQWGEAQGLGRRSDAAVFGLRGVAVQPKQIGQVAARYAKELGLPLTAHALRHTFATWALRKSGNLYAVSKALGHSQLTQTEIYLRSDPADSAPAVGALPAMDAW